ncbi:glycosyltransferase family 87 protein [Nocardioides zhouii]|uniref:glycosyltransferase family 87 protein n=1 Tax=Nocardioides zhouii TaxID=1168729 RepID=UPI0013EAF0FE|nr:glycosyltransferase family 87 protein [Nocardioides zhouii]
MNAQPSGNAPRAGSRAWRIGVMVLFGSALVASCFKYTGLDSVGIDDSVYRTSIMEWWRGGDPYGLGLEGNLAGTSFTYPPVALLLLAPLGALSAVGAHNVMTLVTATCITAMSFIVGRALGLRAGRTVWWQWLVATVLVAGALRSGNAVLSALSLGQVSVFIATLCLVDVLVLRRTAFSGILIAIAAATKVTPGLFIVFLLVFDRRAGIRSLVWAAALTAIAGVVLPSETWNYFTKYLWDTQRVGDAAANANVSVTGVLARSDLGPAAEQWWWIAFSIAAVVLTGAAVRRVWALDSGVWSACLIGQVTCLVSPITWSHHSTWFSLTGAVLMLWAIRSRTQGWFARIGLGVLGVAIIVALYKWALIWSIPGAPVSGLHGFLVQNVLFLIGLSGLVGLGLVAWRTRSAAPESIRAMNGGDGM